MYDCFGLLSIFESLSFISFSDCFAHAHCFRRSGPAVEFEDQNRSINSVQLISIVGGVFTMLMGLPDWLFGGLQFIPSSASNIENFLVLGVFLKFSLISIKAFK